MLEFPDSRDFDFGQLLQKLVTQQAPKLPPVRKPFASEVEFFKRSPGTAGMRTEDGSVILNPFNGPEINQKSVIMNEQARVLFKQGKVPQPDFDITEEQRSLFKGTPYEEDEEALKETIAARILSGDSSAGEPTPEQIEFVEKNLSPMFAFEPQFEGLF